MMILSGRLMKVMYCTMCIFLCVAVVSCKDARFPDYTETKNGLFYKLENIGDGEKKAKPGDYITARIVISLENDSVLFDTKRMGIEGAITFILPPVGYPKDYREGYLFLNEGDSASFITDAYAFFIQKNHVIIPKGMNLKSIVRIDTKVLKIRTPQEHLMEVKEENAKLERGEFEEKKILEKYISDAGIHKPPFANGMYHITLQDGKGITPDSARVVLLNYKGYFLNGRCFDSNFETQPFEYVIGAEDQLISGLVIGVRKMREGEKAKFIIPSHLAFGSSGSSAEVVPPFTTVVYDVELLKVQ